MHESIRTLKSNIIRIWFHFDATILIYKHFEVFFKMIHTGEVYHCNISKKWRRQTKTRHTDQLFKLVFHQDWRLSTRFANWNEHNVTRMFKENLHILVMIYLVTLARIIRLVGDRSIRIAELWNPGRAYRLWLATHRMRSCWDGR